MQQNDSQVAVDISGLGERMDRSRTTTRVGNDEEENQSKRSKLVQCNKARIVTYSIKSGRKETGVVVQGRAKQGWPQKALERGTPT